MTASPPRPNSPAGQAAARPQLVIEMDELSGGAFGRGVAGGIDCQPPRSATSRQPSPPRHHAPPPVTQRLTDTQRHYDIQPPSATVLPLPQAIRDQLQPPSAATTSSDTRTPNARMTISAPNPSGPLPPEPRRHPVTPQQPASE